jgi:DNA-directed RNA polymerase subunit RPC12/RpoP
MILPEISVDDIQTVPQLRNLAYYYVIHGTIPELEPSVAYRRVGAETQHKRKLLKCPYCSSRLTDMDIGTKVELYGHSKRVDAKCQFYIRCGCCHREIGINIA